MFRNRRLRRELAPLLEELERAQGREHIEARQRLLEHGEEHGEEHGDEVVELVVEAGRKGRLAGWKCFDLLLQLGPAGLEATLDCARRDDPLGGKGLEALAKLQNPPLEMLAVLQESLGHRERLKILGTLGAIHDLQPKAETALGAEAADELSALGPRVAGLLDHPDPVVQRQTATAVALLRPPGEGVVSRLLELARNAGSHDLQFACTRALGALGPAATPALDWLRERARGGDDAAILALENLGAVAAPALDDLAAARDGYQAATKSDTKAFRSLVGRAMRSIRAAVKEEAVKDKAARKQAGGAQPEPAASPLVDLLERVEGRDDRGSVVRSSAEQPSSKARDQASRLRDEGLLDEIETLLAKDPPTKRFDGLVLVLASLTRNTGAERGERLLQGLLKENTDDPERLARVHWGLSLGNVSEATGTLLDHLRLRKEAELDVDPYYLLQFFEKHPHPEAIRLLGEMALREAHFGSLVAMWLAELGRQKEPEAREPLEALLLSEDIGYRRKNDLERRGYALGGLIALADPRSAPAIARELEKRQTSTFSACLNALADLDEPDSVSATLDGVRYALRQLAKKGHLSRSERFRDDFVYLAPAVRYLARHLGKDDADVADLESELRAAAERGDLPPAELELLDAPDAPEPAD